MFLVTIPRIPSLVTWQHDALRFIKTSFAKILPLPSNDLQFLLIYYKSSSSLFGNATNSRIAMECFSTSSCLRFTFADLLLIERVLHQSSCCTIAIKMFRFFPLIYFLSSVLTETFASELNTNIWAVKMSGGRQEVEKLALKYDLSYDKHVSTASLCAFRLNCWIRNRGKLQRGFSTMFLKALTCNWSLTFKVIAVVCFNWEFNFVPETWEWKKNRVAGQIFSSGRKMVL